MAALKTINFPSCTSCSSSTKRINAAISIPRIQVSVPKLKPKRDLVEELRLKNMDGFTKPIKKNLDENSTEILRLYAIMDSVADRIEMHKNIGEQRDSWNTLLLSSINMITLTASTMACILATADPSSSVLNLRISSTILFSAATGLLLVMNKIQPSQLTEEQRNATRLFTQLYNEIKTKLATNKYFTEEDARDSVEKLLALDRAYPLPLLGAMLEKFPETFQPAAWWPKNKQHSKNNKQDRTNGWSEDLEQEMREVLRVIKTKDSEDYMRLGNMALKINKSLAVAGPILTGIAAIGSAFGGSWVAVAGVLASVVNTFEHGGQVGMVFEMYRNSAGFFKFVEESIESTLENKDFTKRENGDLFEIKVALQLGRSLSELREFALKSRISRMAGGEIDEFGSKLF